MSFDHDFGFFDITHGYLGYDAILNIDFDTAIGLYHGEGVLELLEQWLRYFSSRNVEHNIVGTDG